MLIGISGNICSGKAATREYLVLNGFEYLCVETTDGSVESHAGSTSRTFPSLNDLLLYATQRWSQDFVTDVEDLVSLEALAKRPFFLHLSIDAPTVVRWKRYCAKRKASGLPEPDMEQFVTTSDDYMYNKSSKGAMVMGKAQVVVINGTDNIELLYVSLGKLNLLDETRLRPSWDAYFMRLADLAALRSNCMKRRVGCVLVRDKRVMATGYNGTPRGLKNCNEGGCERCNSANGSGSSLATCLCLHAEENAILESGRDRLGNEGILYCNTCPCLTCSIKIVQSGIREVVYSQSYSMDDSSAKVLQAGGIVLRQYSPPSERILVL